MAWGDKPASDVDSLKIINKGGTRMSHQHLIWLEYTADDNDQVVSVWLEDPEQFMNLITNHK